MTPHPTFSTNWHNSHGLRRWQLDPSAAIIRLLEMLGLAWDVVRDDDARLQHATGFAHSRESRASTTFVFAQRLR